MFGTIGLPELIVIMVIALIVFGPRKLPEIGRSLGKSLGEFKRASNELRNTLEEEVRIEEVREQRVKAAAEQQSAVEQPAAPAATEPEPAAAPPVAEAAAPSVGDPSPLDVARGDPEPVEGSGDSPSVQREDPAKRTSSGMPV